MHRRNDRTEPLCRRRDALPRVRRCTSRRSFCCFCERALTLSELRLFPCPVFPFAPSLDVRRRIARERVPTSRNGVSQSNRQTQGFFAEMQSIRPRSGSNPRLLCLTNVYFGQQWEKPAQRGFCSLGALLFAGFLSLSQALLYQICCNGKSVSLGDRLLEFTCIIPIGGVVQHLI